METRIGTIQRSVRTDIFYINDVHGQVGNMGKLVTASRVFDEFRRTRNSDTFKVSAGDVMLGNNQQTLNTAAGFFNLAGIGISTMGNHEMDKGFQAFKRNIEKVRTLFLGTNMNFPSGKDDRIVISTIKEINGHRYGFLGIQPSSLTDRLRDKSVMAGVTIDSPEQTIKELQENIDELKKQGVDKIILLSHSGVETDKRIAKETSGIDIIIGGHSHDLINGANPGENFVYSKSGEPVIITQAGRDGQNFGILSLEFDEKGIIKDVKNTVFDTDQFEIDPEMKEIINREFGEAQVIGKLAEVPPPVKNPLIEENPYSEFIIDIVREKTGADIALLNAANVRGSLKTGDITDRDIINLTPFKNRLTKFYITEKELVDAIKLSAKSLNEEDNKPGLLVTSGLRYIVNKKGELLELTYTDRLGKAYKIDVNNPRKDKKYLCACDEFLTKGGDNFEMLNKMDNLVEYCNYGKDELTIDYIKNLKTPLSLSCDGRMKVVD